jgi:hypothetical protein
MCRHLTAFLVVLGTGCGPQLSNVPGGDCSARDIGEIYFPPALTAGERTGSQLDSLEREYFARELGRLNEGSLRCPRMNDVTAYRVLWLPSCQASIAVRAERDGRKTTLHATKLSSLILGDRDRVSGPVEQVRLDVTAGQLGDIESAFASFWEKPTMEPNEEVLVDGERFIIEGVKDGRYHVLRRSDRKDASLRAAIELMIRAAGWSFEAKGC